MADEPVRPTRVTPPSQPTAALPRRGRTLTAESIPPSAVIPIGPAPAPRRPLVWPWIAAAGGLAVALVVVLVLLLSGGPPPSVQPAPGPGAQVEPKKKDGLPKQDTLPKGDTPKGDPKEKAGQPAPASNLFAKGPVRFLSDLPEQDVRSGQWPFRKGDNGNGQAIRVSGVLSPHGLGMHPPAAPGFASVRYELGKQAVLFKATVAINDTTKWCWSPATFTVLGDGKELWQSKWISHTHARSQECQVIVKGVNWLELRVKVENGNRGVEAVWVEPRVLQKFDSPDTPKVEGGKAAALASSFTRTEILGFPAGDDYEDQAPEGGLLIGFELGLGKWGKDDIVNSVQPIFRTAKGEVRGKMHGGHDGRTVTVKAKEGYAVGAVTVRAVLITDGVRVTFMRVNGNSLDPGQSYQSENIGSLTKSSDRVQTLGGSGASVVGICGRANDASRALGLLLRGKE
jgi:hypothetical protein